MLGSEADDGKRRTGRRPAASGYCPDARRPGRPAGLLPRQATGLAGYRAAGNGCRPRRRQVGPPMGAEDGLTIAIRLGRCSFAADAFLKLNSAASAATDRTVAHVLRRRAKTAEKFGRCAHAAGQQVVVAHAAVQQQEGSRRPFRRDTKRLSNRNPGETPRTATVLSVVTARAGDVSREQGC